MTTFVLDGRRIRIISATRVHAFEREQAQRLLHEALAEGGGQLLRQLADLCDLEPEERHAIIERVAHGIESGRVLVYSEEEIAGGFDPSISGEPIDWDELPRLVDFADPSRREEPTPATTWFSFEIVDERGRAADGTFTCTIDNAPHDAALARRLHSFDALRAGVRAQLSARVEFDAGRTDPSKSHPVTPDPERPDAPCDPNPQGVSFEVVDEEGRLLPGGYVLDDAGETHTGQLGRMTVVPARNAARLQLSVDWCASRSGASA